MLHVPTCRTTNNTVPRRSRPQFLNRPLHQPASLASAMSDLNSPEKPRSEPSLAGSHPHSWSDVTLIEDITQEFSSRHQSAHCLEECLESSSESVAELPSPPEPPPGASPHTDPSTGGLCCQEIQGPKPKSGSGPANRPCLRYNSALPCTLRHRQASPTSAIPGPTSQPRPPCSRHSRLQETDTALVGQLHQEAQNAVGSSTGNSGSTPVSYRARMPQPPSKGGMQPRFFAPPPRWSEHLLGVAVPKPRPLTRPPPRSLVYRPPTQPSTNKVKPLGL